MLDEYTFSLIKPDATKRNITGKINSYLESAHLKIVAQKMSYLSRQQAEKFYSEHKNKFFFDDLILFMISAPVILQILKGKEAILNNRRIMGLTDPQKAAHGTIRKSFAKNIIENSIHGSNNKFNAKREIDFFFNKEEILI